MIMSLFRDHRGLVRVALSCMFIFAEVIVISNKESASGCEWSPSGVETPLDSTTKQIVLVLANSWDSTTGILIPFERNKSGWVQKVHPWKVNLGKNGIAWGLGLHANGGADQPQKKEGDGKAVAGIFKLGKFLGYAERPPKGTRFPYTQETDSLHCVDDGNSSYYNRIVSAGEVSPSGSGRLPWNSSEIMKRKDELYKYVIELQHNQEHRDPAPEAASSSIFSAARILLPSDVHRCLKIDSSI